MRRRSSPRSSACCAPTSAARTTGPWSGLDLDFTGVEFHEADFSEITFEGKVVFDGAVFRGPHTSFERTVFRDMTLSCHGTTFTSDQVSFRHALFDHATVEFVGTDFTGTSIDFAASGIRGRTIDFYRATLTDALIGFRSSEVAGTTIRFERCAVTGSRLDFSYLYPDSEASRSVSRLVLEGCAVRRSEVDLRGMAPDGTDVWFTDSSFDDVHVFADKRSDGKGLKVRRVESVGSILPVAATERNRPSA
ncbi:pentapeptide repeat-containing protein [Saccharothrix saharensis]|uniref:pentapeptide repeat-containing protein n=1 Tax=Saccharothrix saharensis TaxID=571190 RepID=UPI00115473D4|nr:pentapeptide repeat-containing protein [Saccharothrix saharensis]